MEYEAKHKVLLINLGNIMISPDFKRLHTPLENRIQAIRGLIMREKQDKLNTIDTRYALASPKNIEKPMKENVGIGLFERFR